MKIGKCPHCDGDLMVMVPAEMVEDGYTKQEAVIEAVSAYLPLLGQMLEAVTFLPPQGGGDIREVRRDDSGITHDPGVSCDMEPCYLRGCPWPACSCDRTPRSGQQS